MGLWRIVYRIFQLLPATLILSCSQIQSAFQTSYVTRDGLEPDRWASVWLIKNKINPGAEIIIRPPAGDLGRGIAFAVAGSAYGRTASMSAFSRLLGEVSNKDPALIRMSELLDAIETTSWGLAGTDAAIVEEAFRGLQLRYRRVDVPVACYLAFFDNLYRALRAKNQDLAVSTLMPGADCERTVTNTLLVYRDGSVAVDTVNIPVLLSDISSGKNIIFVDVREPQEYAEMHIPYAINVQLRNIPHLDLSELRKADRVIAYCIKDFRGYEAALALARRGLRNVATMKPYGLAGWRSLDLPVVEKELDEAEAAEQLRKISDSTVRNAS